jgi:acetylornithine deacetylase/succinyl-diaminopimelate desuccinylase-like protein
MCVLLIEKKHFNKKIIQIKIQNPFTRFKTLKKTNNSMKKYTIPFLLIFLTAQVVSSQSAETLKIRNFTQKNANKIITEFSAFLSLPNVAAAPASLQKNANFIMSMMDKKGIKNVQLLHGETADIAPAVYGEVITPGATQTLIFYAHYDGQPVNPQQWDQNLDPFVPKLYNGAIDKNGIAIPFPLNGKYNNEWMIYARSASDDKAGIAAILNAYESIDNSGLKPTFNLKFFFEGEEEAGSPHLGQILKKNKDLLQSDLWIICDGPVHQSGKKQIYFGVRGDTHLDLTVYASKRPLHSGHYGNWAPNPAMMLSQLLASMKDENGRVAIKGFYDDVIPLSPSEKKALEEVPSVDEQMKSELGLHAEDMKGISLSESINLPSLNINGMQSGNVGKMASNQIPTFATAVLDLRLVLGNDFKKQQQKVIDHIKAQGYFITDTEPTDEERKNHGKIIKVIAGDDGINAQRTSMDLTIIKKVIVAVQTTTNDQIVLQPTMGGSLPLYLFEKHLNAKTISVPIANHDNNQHAENENIRLQNLFDGIETMGVLMLLK